MLLSINVREQYGSDLPASAVANRFYRSFVRLAVAFASCLSPSALAQADEQGPPVALTFAAAQARFEQQSKAESGADHTVAAARETAAAVATLHRPIVTASAAYVAYQKTFAVDLRGPKQQAIDDTQQFLSGLPAQFPPGFQDFAGQISARLGQALPGLFSAIPDSLTYRYRDEVLRPTVQAVLPIYSGGAFPAVQKAAGAGVTLAMARARQVGDSARIDLVRAYFGQLAAQALEASSAETRDALQGLFDDARRLEAEGVAPHLRTLEAQVARDTAEQAYQRAALAHQGARDDLADKLELTTVRPVTPLFVQSRPLPPLSQFQSGVDRLPLVRQAAATRDVASAEVGLARSRYRPQVFGFGEYNFNRDQALPTDPDWIVGIGARITLFSNIGRGHTLAAARQHLAAADDATLEARKTASSATRHAWNLAESARRSFLLLDSSIAAARENLRVRRISFREGEATLTEVLGAEAALADARARRIASAYEFDLALAGLLASAGELDRFDEFLAEADIRVTPEPAR